MAKQLNLLATGQIIPTALHQEMERSYLEYAMSVIVGRALPDVRDGLKPVHRRILYAMYELGLTPDRPYRKCARVVGDVLGKYHPHGDQAVYDALVRMVQDFSSRYPLLGGHGNFGSVDNDPPAAMRYTETRLSALAFEATLDNISEAIVDFTNNFDNSQQEPVVLPAQLPLLLLNGCTGIAVGMATSIPPHHLGEIVDALIALIDNPQLPDEQLWQIIPGPDFPTGGEILDTEGIKEAYRTGKGIIPVRGVTKIEKISLEGRRPKERTAIVVTELPYQVNKSAWIEKVAELVNQGRLEGIADLRDESDRQGMRVVIELKRETDTQTVLENLYRQTALQSNFGAILLGLVNNKPCQLSLKQLLAEFLKFRERTLVRQYGHELEQSQNRVHLLDGLLIALKNLDQVVDILRHAADGTTAKLRMQETLNLSEAQADSILAMPMRRLTGLERQKLQTEHEELQQRINQLQTLLTDRHELMKSLKKELRSLKRRFADERRTRINGKKAEPSKGEGRREKGEGRREKGAESQEVDNSEQVTQQRKQKAEGRRQKAEPGKEKAEGRTEQGAESQEINNSEQVTQQRKQTTKNGDQVTSPPSTPSTPSTPSPPSPSTPLTLFTPQPPPKEAILKMTYQGCIYWEFPGIETNSPPSIPTGADFPILELAIQEREQLIIITNKGKAYPVSVLEIPPKESQSVNLINLLPKSAQRDAEKIIGHFFPSENPPDLILLSQQGRIKRLSVSELKDLGDRGLSLMRLKEGDSLSSICLTQLGEEIAIATTGGRVLRFAVEDSQLPMMGRSSPGNQALRCRSDENIAGCLPLKAQENLLLVSQSGYGKRLALNHLRLMKLGDIGSHVLQFTGKTDNLAGMVLAKSGGHVVLITSYERRFVISIDSVALWGKDGFGDRLVNLKPEESILKVINC